MRVGLVIYGSLETSTGGYLHDRRLVEHLTSRGDTVEVIALPWRSYPRHLADNLSPSLLRRLAGAQFDLLLQDELNHPSLVGVNRRLRARADYPIVALVHVLRSSERSASPLRPLYEATERRYLATVDGAMFNSEATRAATEHLLGRALPGVVARPGCDHLATPAPDADSVSRALEPGPLRVLSVANVLPGKGLHVLLEALARLPAGSWRLTVLGSLSMDTSYAERIRRQIRGAGLGADIDLVGPVPNAEVPGYLVRSHVLVVPSFYEAFGIAYLEAMKFGLPVIATAAGGPPELVTHDSEGFLVAPGDVDALTEHLQRWLADRGLVVRMGLAARRRADRHPTWEQSLEPVHAFLRSLVESRQRQVRRETAT